MQGDFPFDLQNAGADWSRFQSTVEWSCEISGRRSPDDRRRPNRSVGNGAESLSDARYFVQEVAEDAVADQ